MADDRAYRIQVTFDAKNERFEARVPELDVSAKGESRAEAITNVESEIEALVERSATGEDALPDPVDATPAEPGEITLSLSGPLMNDLRYAAERNKMSVDELATQLLSRAIGTLDGRAERRPSRPRKAEAAEAEEGGEDQQPRDDRGGRNRGRGRSGGSGGGSGSGGGRGRRNEGYRPDIDDQASFLAYVREQERGGRGRR